MPSPTDLPGNCNATFSWEPSDAVSRLERLSSSLRMKVVEELLSPSCCVVRPAVKQPAPLVEYLSPSTSRDNGTIHAKRAADARSSPLKFTYLIVMTTSHARMHNVAVAHRLWMRFHDHLIVSSHHPSTSPIARGQTKHAEQTDGGYQVAQTRQSNAGHQTISNRDASIRYAVHQEPSAPDRAVPDYLSETLIGMRYGSQWAQKALAGTLCAHARAGRPYDWMLLVDDDTVVDVHALDRLLTQKNVSDPQRVPRMLGQRVDRQLEGSLESETACRRIDSPQPCFRAVDPLKAHLPWSYTVGSPKTRGTAPPSQRGPWAVGWPYGGTGIVISRAAMHALATVGSECVRCLTCPVRGSLSPLWAVLNNVSARDSVRTEVHLGFGACGAIPYDPGARQCGGGFTGFWESRVAFKREPGCVESSLRCAGTDVQLGLCFGRAGLAPQPLVADTGAWSAHLKHARADAASFRDATADFLRARHAVAS